MSQNRLRKRCIADQSIDPYLNIASDMNNNKSRGENNCRNEVLIDFTLSRCVY